MLTKDKMHQLIDHMPDSFSADDIIEEIILLHKIEMAEQQIANGEFLTEEEIRKEIDSWG
jgi:predicted transcriptional regulator